MPSPKLLNALLEQDIQTDIRNKAILGYSDKSDLKYGNVYFIDSGLTLEQIQLLVDKSEDIVNHIDDDSMHWSYIDRRDYEKLTEDINAHLKDSVIHVTQDDRNSWDSKETEAGAQEKANVVQTNLEVHMNDLDVHTTKKERDRWNNTYTREEVANMVATAQSNSVWKEAVDTYDSLAVKYPKPEKGWICTVLDTMVTYSYNGEEWVVAFINTMPLATEEINGLLSAEMYKKLAGIEYYANYYIHPDNVNCRHVTDLQIKKWDAKAEKTIATIFQNGLMSSSDKDKLDTMERYANYYVHPDFHSADMIEETDQRRFVTTEQIETWSNPVGVMASETQDGAMSKEMYIKLAEIEEKANYYVHPAKHSSTDIAEDKEHRFVTDLQIAYWDAKEETTASQARADQALQLAKEYTDQVKSDILGGAGGAFDTLKELQDALGADANFSTTVLTDLSNKVDKEVYYEHVNDYNTHLDDDDRLKLDSVAYNANYYIHPESHPASMIITSSNYRFVTDGDIAYWNSKAPGTLASPTEDGIMSAEMYNKLAALSETGKVRSDWLQTDSNADSYILNKPDTMPANGGNADTVGGYKASELKSSNKAVTFVIGPASSGFTDKDVDYLCDGTNDVSQIRLAIEAMPTTGGSLLFREGTYIFTETLELDLLDVKLEGSGNTTFKNSIMQADSIMLRLSATNCTIKNITFDGTGMSSTGCCLYIDGNTNLITDCQFINGTNAIRLSSGSYNKVIANDFNTNARAIFLEAPNKEAYGNVICENTILDCSKEGILLMSSLNYKVSNTVVNSNSIWNAYTGIRLTNEYMSANTVNTIINGNNIMRGTGLNSDYQYEQRTVYIEYGEHNLVVGNMLMGHDAFDKTTTGTNILTNNMSV